MTFEKMHFTHRLLLFYVVVKMCQLAAGKFILMDRPLCKSLEFS